MDHDDLLTLAREMLEQCQRKLPYLDDAPSAYLSDFIIATRSLQLAVENIVQHLEQAQRLRPAGKIHP